MHFWLCYSNLYCAARVWTIWMSNNLFGEIPLPCPGYEEPLNSLVFYSASSNHLSGCLDGSISNFRQLSTLDHNNSLTGSLASTLSNLSFLNYLDLSNNDFRGSIPCGCGICHLFGITFANFSGNRIGRHNFSDCAASGICAPSINHKEGHPHHVIWRAVTICATVSIVILLVAYVGCKLLRNRSLPLAPVSEP